jgi:hypothetical protein
MEDFDMEASFGFARAVMTKLTLLFPPRREDGSPC